MRRLRRIGDLNPLGTRNFWVIGGAEFQSPPRWYPLQGRSPAYPFFRKEKIQLYMRRRKYDAECSERVLLRSHSLQEGAWCYARNPPAIRFAPGPPPFNKGGKRFLRLTEVCAGIPMRRRESPARRRELFSLRKKRTA